MVMLQNMTAADTMKLTKAVATKYETVGTVFDTNVSDHHGLLLGTVGTGLELGGEIFRSTMAAVQDKFSFEKLLVTHEFCVDLRETNRRFVASETLGPKHVFGMPGEDGMAIETRSRETRRIPRAAMIIGTIDSLKLLPVRKAMRPAERTPEGYGYEALIIAVMASQCDTVLIEIRDPRRKYRGPAVEDALGVVESDLDDVGYRIFTTIRSGGLFGGGVHGDERVYVCAFKKEKTKFSYRLREWMMPVLNIMEHVSPNLEKFLDASGQQQADDTVLGAVTNADTPMGQRDDRSDHRSVFRELDLQYPPPMDSFLRDVLQLKEDVLGYRQFTILTLREKELLYFVEHVSEANLIGERVVDLGISIKQMKTILAKETVEANGISGDVSFDW